MNICSRKLFQCSNQFCVRQKGWPGPNWQSGTFYPRDNSDNCWLLYAAPKTLYQGFKIWRLQIVRYGSPNKKILLKISYKYSIGIHFHLRQWQRKSFCGPSCLLQMTKAAGARSWEWKKYLLKMYFSLVQNILISSSKCISLLFKFSIFHDPSHPFPSYLG